MFRNRMAAENEATKNIKIKIRRRLKRLENIIKNATINEKRAASTEGRWDGTRERRGRRGSVIRSFRGQLSWAGGGKLRRPLVKIAPILVSSADLGPAVLPTFRK